MCSTCSLKLWIIINMYWWRPKVRATVKMKITKLSDTNICHQTTLIKKYDITFDRPPNVITDIWETYLLINGYLTRANIIWSRLHSAPPIMVAIQLYIYMEKKKSYTIHVKRISDDFHLERKQLPRIHRESWDYYIQRFPFFLSLSLSLFFFFFAF